MFLRSIPPPPVPRFSGDVASWASELTQYIEENLRQFQLDIETIGNGALGESWRTYEDTDGLLIQYNDGTGWTTKFKVTIS